MKILSWQRRGSIGENIADILTDDFFDGGLAGTNLLHNLPNAIMDYDCYDSVVQLEVSAATAIGEAFAYYHFLGLKGLLIPLVTNVISAAVKAKRYLSSHNQKS